MDLLSSVLREAAKNQQDCQLSYPFLPTWYLVIVRVLYIMKTEENKDLNLQYESTVRTDSISSSSCEHDAVLYSTTGPYRYRIQQDDAITY